MQRARCAFGPGLCRISGILGAASWVTNCLRGYEVRIRKSCCMSAMANSCARARTAGQWPPRYRPALRRSTRTRPCSRAAIVGGALLCHGGPGYFAHSDLPMRRNVRCCCAGPSSVSQRVAQEAFKKHGLTITPIAEIDALDTLRRAIASGIGNSILPWSALYDGEEKNCAELPALRRRETGPARCAVLFRGGPAQPRNRSRRSDAQIPGLRISRERYLAGRRYDRS